MVNKTLHFEEKSVTDAVAKFKNSPHQPQLCSFSHNTPQIILHSDQQYIRSVADLHWWFFEMLIERSMLYTSIVT